MIISRAPFRISYVGGGTDFEDYYRQDYGTVISTTIDKYIYVILNKKFDDRIYVRYSQSECVDRVDDLKHSLVREAMRMFGIEKGVEIVTISDIPAAGSGLGSSSSLAAALLLAFAKYQNRNLGKRELAEMTCKLEIDILKEPIGRQDQYAVVYGGFNIITFRPYNIIEIEQDWLSRKHWLNKASLLFYLGNGRKSGEILIDHKNSIKNKRKILNKQRDLVQKFKLWLNGQGEIELGGEIVSRNWQYKKEMTSQASNEEIENIINRALKAGACGAKVCGAGGGGFLLVICCPEKQAKVREVLGNLVELKFNFSENGAGIVYAD